jgi:hypothetical protein
MPLLPHLTMLKKSESSEVLVIGGALWVKFTALMSRCGRRRLLLDFLCNRKPPPERLTLLTLGCRGSLKVLAEYDEVDVDEISKFVIFFLALVVLLIESDGNRTDVNSKLLRRDFVGFNLFTDRLNTLFRPPPPTTKVFFLL